MPANGFDSLLISAHPQFPSETFALIDWENGRMEFSVGTDQNPRILITICWIVIKTQELRSQFSGLSSESQNCDHTICRLWSNSQVVIAICEFSRSIDHL